MQIDPEKLTVSINDGGSVTAMLYPATKKDRAGITVILGHGAGANQLSPFLRLFASGLAGRGFDAMTFNFLYMELGKRVPDQNAKLEDCYRAVIQNAAAQKKLKGNRIVIGGKSMGGRIASQVAASFQRTSKGETKQQAAPNEVDLAGLVLLGYPLHPPGRPEKLRDAHLKDIRAPILFIQGSRDAFGTPDELRATIKKHKLPATLHIIDGGDHSFKVPKSAGSQQQVYDSVMDKISSWLPRV